jgi:hypothetical protein
MMKKLYFGLAALLITVAAFSQIKYDDGPIITGGNFVISGDWGRNNLTFSFQNGTNDIAGNDERNAIRQAFQIWADYADLNFTEVTNNADIVILWATGNHGDGFPFDGQNGVLAHAFFPPPNGGAIAGDVHFDDDEIWSMNMQAIGAQPIDLVTVAAHEIGHALGLGHSNVFCALMNPFYTGSHRYLSQDDVDGIQTIYGNRTVVRTTNLTCTGGTFFISNLPVGATVNWTSSNNAIATVTNNNNQGTVSRVGNASGNVRITATITLPCGATVVEFQDINIGAPPAPADIVGMDIAVHFSAGQYVTLSIDEIGISYNWSVAGGIIIGSSTGQSIYVKLDNCFPNQNAYNELSVTVSYENECGYGASRIELAYAECNGEISPEFNLMVSPNPSGGDLNVETTNESPKVKQLGKNTIVQYDLYDLYTKQLVKHWTFKNDQNRRLLNVRSLKKGMYVLTVTKGNYQQSKKVIIQ